LQAISKFIFIAEDVAFNEEKHQFVKIGFPAFSEPIGRGSKNLPWNCFPGFSLFCQKQVLFLIQ
jgi:hypothetical protein